MNNIQCFLDEAVRDIAMKYAEDNGFRIIDCGECVCINEKLYWFTYETIDTLTPSTSKNDFVYNPEEY